MSYADPDDRPSMRAFLVPLVLMLASFAFLAFGPGFDTEYAGWGAQLVFPLSFGALLTLSSRFYSPLGCLGAPVLLGLASFVLVKLGIEGMACVVMVMPVWFVLGLGGGIAALYLRRVERRRAGGGPTRLHAAGLAVLPFVVMAVEGQVPPQWQGRTVTRSVIVDAAPAQVWPLLVAIPEVGPAEGIWTATHDLVGIPRPSDAQLVRRGGVAVREARWGDAVRFEEIVTDTVPNRSIAWRFAFPDNSVQMHTDRHISPDGAMLRILDGGYTLDPLADGRTRVTLHTRYAMRTRFGGYFGWWGERLLGDVEANVLAIIHDRAAAAAAAAR